MVLRALVESSERGLGKGIDNLESIESLGKSSWQKALSASSESSLLGFRYYQHSR